MPQACARLFVDEGASAQSKVDVWLSTADQALKSLSGAMSAARPCPKADVHLPPSPLTPQERALSGALMRVNHVGEVCAQALYLAQAMSCQDLRLRKQFLDAAREEADHLAWTSARLRELGARPSLLNPLWFTGAFAIGCIAGRVGDRTSLGFMKETERQVEAHLASHLTRLPEADIQSRAIVDTMKADEAAHARAAEDAGARELPQAAKAIMRLAAMFMTRTAHHL